MEDARQEVLLRLARHVDVIHGSVAAWLSATTRSVCVDWIRRQARQRRRVAEYADLWTGPTDDMLIAESLRRRLDDALALLEPRMQALVRQRFLRGVPLRDVASEFRTSMATASRHVARALAELQRAYESLGVDGFTGDTLADTLAGDAWRHYTRDPGLTPYMRRPTAGPGAAAGDVPAPTGPNGWPRPIRIGVVVSHTSARLPNHLGSFISIDNQVLWIRFLADPRFELIAVIEPKTEDQPQIERIIRGYDLTAGLMYGTDPDALRTLDVIYLGWQARISAPLIRAIADAVREGVGCYNAGVTYTHEADYHRTTRENHFMQGLRLSDAVLGAYCTTDVGWSKGRHMVCVPVTIQNRHETLPGLEPGDRLMLGGCGLLLRPAPGVQVLATQERLVRHTCQCHECRASPMSTGELPMHEILVGNYGRGRVFMSQSPETEPLINHPKTEGDWLENLFLWLAEPRRPQPLACAP